MVSFWPWRSSSSSPDSFEKTLSALSAKISAAQSSLDGTRSRGRRVKVLGTLYLSFGYLVYAIVLLLVVGWRRLGAAEWAGVVAGPVGIWALRAAVSAYYGVRGETLQSRLAALQAERADTIRKLKDATRYDSTLHLLEKYGGGGGGGGRKRREVGRDGEADGEEAGGGRRRQTDSARQTPSRTGLPPPPTANIVRDIRQRPSTSPYREKQQLPPSSPSSPETGNMEEHFSPNASSPAHAAAWAMAYHQPAPAPPSEPHWYDRILDTLLGEDEVAAKNRIVLICAACRLVNGQAPPGTKRLSELGPWKCMACGAPNGDMHEVEKVARHVVRGRSSSVDVAVEGDDDVDVVDMDVDMDRGARGGDESGQDDSPSRRRKGKTKD